MEGRSMVNIIATASELGYLDVPENTLIEIDQMRIIRRRKWFLSQPEVRESLWRLCREWRRTCTEK